MFLVAEYCKGPFYMGWHLYLRENRDFRRNKSGNWGWIRNLHEHPVKDFLSSIGITIRGDGTCEDDGVAQFAAKYPAKGCKLSGKTRGCVGISVNKSGKINRT